MITSQIRSIRVNGSCSDAVHSCEASGDRLFLYFCSVDCRMLGFAVELAFPRSHYVSIMLLPPNNTIFFNTRSGKGVMPRGNKKCNMRVDRRQVTKWPLCSVERELCPNAAGSYKVWKEVQRVKRILGSIALEMSLKDQPGTNREWPLDICRVKSLGVVQWVFWESGQ